MGYFSLIPVINMYGVSMLSADICLMEAALRFLAAIPMVAMNCCHFQYWPSLPSSSACSRHVLFHIKLCRLPLVPWVLALLAQPFILLWLVDINCHQDSILHEEMGSSL